MNIVILTGRLTRDPDVRTTPSGKQVASFTVATDEYSGGTKSAEFHDCTAWEKTAEAVGRMKKGQRIGVNGRLQTRSWEDKETGEKRRKTEVVANRIEYLESKAASTGTKEEDDELPFNFT